MKVWEKEKIKIFLIMDCFVLREFILKMPTPYPSVCGGDKKSRKKVKKF